MNLFIDTNIFLSFFHFASDDLEEIHKLAVLIKEKKVTLWLPEQVKDEFYRNRDNKLKDTNKKILELNFKPQFPQIFKDYDEYNDIVKILHGYNHALSSIKNQIEKDIIEQNLKADNVIKELFVEPTKLINTTSEILQEASARKIIGNPPGKGDSYGDEIIWESLLKALPENEDLFGITDDNDYYSLLNKEEIKDFLRIEWQKKKNSDIRIYKRLSEFFKEFYPQIQLATELEKEILIEDLVNSTNFSNTHCAISKLNTISDFNQLQVNELVSACLNNDQIRWIIKDSDVNYFYTKLVKNFFELIEHDALEEIKLLL